MSKPDAAIVKPAIGSKVRKAELLERLGERSLSRIWHHAINPSI